MGHQIVECPGCLAKLKIRESDGIIRFQCPRCGEQLEIGDAPEAPPPSGSRRSTNPSSRSGESRSSGRALNSERSRPAAPTEQRGGGGRSPSRERSSGAAAPTRRSRETSAPAGRDDDDGYDQWSAPSPGRGGSGRGGSGRGGKAPGQSSKLPMITIGVLAVLLVVVTVALVMRSPDKSTDQAVADQNEASQVEGDSTEAAPAAEKPPESQQPGNSAAAKPDSQQPSSPPGAGPSPVLPSKPGVVAASGRRLKYKWTPGAEHFYELNIRAGENNSQHTVTGSCTYQVGEVLGRTEDQEATGTGFVVSSDGNIATCAHVIEGAKQILVTLGGREYPATVVAANSKADVAIIRIQASGLTPLKFQDSDAVQAAEAVRVIGFPLSDVLGTDPKITTGTISGIVSDVERGKRIQVDAPINPGNSGGPVVNDAAQVIGVASAKLASSMVTSVGFVSPVNDLIELMKSNGMRVASAERGEPMTGPEVARLVTPCVAYIKVRGSLAAQETGVTYTASFVHNQPAGGGRPDFPFGGMPMMPSQSSDNGKLHVTEFGEIDEYTGESQLPFVLGPVGMFFIERLDSFSESAWVHEEETMLFRIEKQESGPFGFHPRMNFGPPGMHGPFGQPEPDKVAETIPAIERTGWKTEQELNGKISLRKTYEFTTTPNPDRPYMKIRGSGTVVFDTAAGMPQSMEYDAVLESFQESGSVRIPLHVSYTMRNPEDVRRERELAQKQQAEEQARLEKERTTPDAKVVDELLAAVKAAEGGMAASAPFSRLSEVAVVEDRRQKVLTVARRHAKNSNQFVQASAAAAFAHWATVNEFDDLIKIMDEDDHLLYDAQNKLVATLATFNDKRSYPVFLTALSRTFVAEEAKKAMIAVGPPIEDFILEQFNDLSEEKAKHGCLAVLKAIGTMKSETMLEKAATGSGGDFWVRKAAQEALDAIRSRE